MLYMIHVISLIYEHFYRSGAMMLWNAMMLLMTSFEREAHRRIFQDATHFLRSSTAPNDSFVENVVECRSHRLVR